MTCVREFLQLFFLAEEGGVIRRKTGRNGQLNEMVPGQKWEQTGSRLDVQI